MCRSELKLKLNGDFVMYFCWFWFLALKVQAAVVIRKDLVVSMVGKLFDLLSRSRSYVQDCSQSEGLTSWSWPEVSRIVGIGHYLCFKDIEKVDPWHGTSLLV